MSFSRMNLITSNIILLLLVWDHAALLCDCTWRPKLALDTMRVWSILIWSEIGYYVAVISSLVLKLRMDELIYTLLGLISPVIGVLCSPLFFYVTYCNTLLTHYADHMYTVLASTIVVLTLALYGFVKHALPRLERSTRTALVDDSPSPTPACSTQREMNRILRKRGCGHPQCNKGICVFVL